MLITRMDAVGGVLVWGRHPLAGTSITNITSSVLKVNIFFFSPLIQLFSYLLCSYLCIVLMLCIPVFYVLSGPYFTRLPRCGLTSPLDIPSLKVMILLSLLVVGLLKSISMVYISTSGIWSVVRAICSVNLDY